MGRRAGSVSSRPVLVVHGLWMPGAETLLLRRRLAGAGFEPLAFRYRSVSAGLDEVAAELAARVEALGAPAVDLVGHSLGGVVALTMLERLRPAHEGRVVCLGSPLKGCLAAERLGRWPGGKALRGAAVGELVARGGLTTWRGTQALGIVAGDLPISFGRLLGRLPGANDGTVTVDETRLDGASDHVVVHTSHIGLVFSRDAAEATVRFLRHGSFRS